MVGKFVLIEREARFARDNNGQSYRSLCPVVRFVRFFLTHTNLASEPALIHARGCDVVGLVSVKLCPQYCLIDYHMFKEGI